MMGFSSTSLLSARKRESVTPGGTWRIDNTTRRKTQRAGIIIIIIKGVTPAGSTQRYYITGRSGEEERQENTEK